VTDLERFFRQLVANLAESDPSRLHRPIPLEDVQRDVLPYRANRRALELDSSEEYEMVLLRLCAGEGSFVRTDPEEARARFAEEARSTNPDLRVLGRFENVLISLRSEPLARALGPEPDPGEQYSPRPPAPPPIPGLDLSPLDSLDETGELDGLMPGEEPVAPAEAHCLYCGGALPGDRPIRFCPHCGQLQSPPECPQCHSEVDPGWRHCVNCGMALADR